MACGTRQNPDLCCIIQSGNLENHNFFLMKSDIELMQWNDLGSSESPHTAVCLAGESCDKMMLNQVLCNRQKSQEDRKRA